jgi:hypothetical protein
MSSVVEGAAIINPDSSIDSADASADASDDADATVKSNTDKPLVPDMSKYFKTPIEVLGQISQLNPKQFGKIVVDGLENHIVEGAAIGLSYIPFVGSEVLSVMKSVEFAKEVGNEIKEKLDGIVPPLPSEVAQVEIPPVEAQVEEPTVAPQEGGKYKNINQLGGINTKKSNAIIRRIHNSRKIFNNTNKCNNANKSNKCYKGNKNKTYKSKKHMKTKRRYK